MAGPNDVKDAAKALEAVLLRQMLRESKAFAIQGQGGHVVSDFLVEAIAEAVANSGDLGFAAAIENAAKPQPSDPKGQAQADTGLEHLIVSDGRTSSAFGARRDPITHEASFHHGVDIAAPRGEAIRTPEGGVVTFAGARGGYGLCVEVDHGAGVTTRYAHADRLHVVVGQHINAGDAIADVGSTGRSTGPHVHMEARVDGRISDPHHALQIYRARADSERSATASRRVP